MSEFDELFSLPEDKNKKELKKAKKSTGLTPTSPLIPQRSSIKKVPRTTKIDETKQSGMVTKEDLQTIRNDLLEAMQNMIPSKL